MPKSPGNHSSAPTQETTRHLRTLAHDLSNSLETILQAAYLLTQSKLDENGKKWAGLIDSAAQDAARINREIREILKANNQESYDLKR